MFNNGGGGFVNEKQLRAFVLSHSILETILIIVSGEGDTYSVSV